MHTGELTSDAHQGTESPMRILVIEDDRDAASWLVKGLKEINEHLDGVLGVAKGGSLAMSGERVVLVRRQHRLQYAA